MSMFRLSVVTELTIDSASLQALSTSIKEPEEKLKKVDLAIIREAFDDGKLQAVHWCTGTKLIADSLTKENPQTAALLIQTLSSEYHRRPAEVKTNLGLLAEIDNGMLTKGVCVERCASIPLMHVAYCYDLPTSP